jgi:hypothetical protein
MSPPDTRTSRKRIAKPRIAKTTISKATQRKEKLESLLRLLLLGLPGEWDREFRYLARRDPNWKLILNKVTSELFASQSPEQIEITVARQLGDFV